MKKQGLTTKQKIIRALNPITIPLVKWYWKTFKPLKRGVKVIITNGNDVLVVRHTYLSGARTFPGGKTEKNEDSKEAARREVSEELGLDLKSLEFIETFESNHYGCRDFIDIFTAESATKKTTPSEFEIKDAVWHSKDNMPKLGPVSTKMFAIYEEWRRDK